MDEGGGVWSFMPGDEIDLDIQLLTRSRVASVLAVFPMRGVTSGSRSGPVLALGGENFSNAYEFERTSEGRLTWVRLNLNDEHSATPLAAGDYSLTYMEVFTFNGTGLPLDYVPDLTIRIEQEPSDERTARITGFDFLKE